MRVISIKTIKYFWEKKHRDSEQSLKSWYHEVVNERWKKPNDVKKKYGNASILNNNRIVFNINGNKYRLVVSIKYEFELVYIRFIGTHEEYNNINAEII